MALRSESKSVFSTMRPMHLVVKEANAKIKDAIEGKRPSYVTRWSTINKSIESIQEGEIIVIGGRPGSGKSAFANLLVEDLFNTHINPYNSLGLYFSLEMPAYQQVVRMYSNRHRIESKKILSSLDPIEEATFRQLSQTGENMSNLPIYFEDVPRTPEAIANTARQAMRENEDRQVFLIIDHTRLMTGSEEERLRIENMVSYANTMKNDSGLITIFLSQMNRDIEKERDRRRMGHSLPVMADLFASSALEQYATTVMLLHRPEAYGVETFMSEPTKNLLVVSVAKQRAGWTGAILLKTEFPYYDIHDGNTVTMTDNGYVFRFAE